MLLTFNAEHGCWSRRAVQQFVLITVFPFALPAIFILSKEALLALTLRYPIISQSLTPPKF